MGWVAHPPGPKAPGPESGHFQREFGWVGRHRGPKPTPPPWGVCLFPWPLPPQACPCHSLPLCSGAPGVLDSAVPRTGCLLPNLTPAVGPSRAGTVGLGSPEAQVCFFYVFFHFSIWQHVPVFPFSLFSCRGFRGSNLAFHGGGGLGFPLAALPYRVMAGKKFLWVARRSTPTNLQRP